MSDQEKERYGDWIQTVTGGQFWPLDPRVEDIRIEDIAWSLAKVCRFGGHCLVPYSVGQHCVLGSYVVESRTEDPKLALAFLLHDASEAYLGDVTRPLKHMPEFAFYREAEDRLLNVLEAKFKVSFEDPIIKEVDNLMLSTERRDFLIEGPGWTRNSKPLELPLTRWGWRKTGKRYLKRYEQLRKKHQQLLKEQGFLVFCSNCGGLLNDDSQCPMTPQYGVYVYTCEKCGERSTFDMMAPVPLRVDA